MSAARVSTQSAGGLDGRHRHLFAFVAEREVLVAKRKAIDMTIELPLTKWGRERLAGLRILERGGTQPWSAIALVVT